MGSLQVQDSPYHYEEVDWNHYHRYRPRYPSSLWKLLDSYQHGPLHSLHDVGAGGGAGSASLLRTLPDRITHLILSDPNPGNLESAARLLKQAVQPRLTHLDFRVGNAEDALLAPGEYVDALTVCMAIHWLSIPVFLTRVAESLRPGGTFMAVQYNPYPVIVNNPRASQKLRDFIDACYGNVDPEALKGDAWGQAALQMAKGVGIVDVLGVDSRFRDVVRLEINTERSQGWWFPPTLLDALGGHGKGHSKEARKLAPVQKVENYVDWGRYDVDLDWIRGFLSTLRGSSRAGFSPGDRNRPEWRALEAEVDGPLDIAWQVYVILARRA